MNKTIQDQQLDDAHLLITQLQAEVQQLRSQLYASSQQLSVHEQNELTSQRLEHEYRAQLQQVSDRNNLVEQRLAYNRRLQEQGQ